MIEIKILFENSHLIVADKPAGILSQPDKSGDPDIAAILKEELGYEFLAAVHRLDRNTSGCLILAKSSAAAKNLTASLKAGKVKRTYQAVVKGAPEEKGEIDAPLAKDEEENLSYVSDAGKKAITKYVRLKKWGATSLVEVRLETGRSHQIRAHFAHIGCPLIGDKKYAKKPWSEIHNRPALHAVSIEFPDPESGKSKEVSCSIPQDLRKLIEKLGV